MIPGVSGATYSSAGVDLGLYREGMARLPAHMRRTQCPRVMSQEGGFAALFQLDFKGLFARGYEDPLLVSCTDGVGTKLKVAVAAGVHHTVGIDLVAMSVNDLICTGGDPLVFLDYLAMPKDDTELTLQLVRGISEGCVQSGCALVGGETAILPEFYQADDFDLAGFATGVVERDEVIDGRAIRSGDVLIGLASSGLHSNGYSLARKIVFTAAGLTVQDHVAELGTTVGEALLTPTKLYAKPIRAMLATHRSAVTGLANITGGGLPDNLGRILPPNVDANIDSRSWSLPPLFAWMQKLGNVATAEMQRVFNCGVGFVVVAKPEAADSVLSQLRSSGETAWKLGEIANGSAKVTLA
jgi:phosphoribosylformylglycinamidine cyclo-ligase